MKKVLSVFIALVMIVPLMIEGFAQLARDREEQKDRLGQLEAQYAAGDFSPVDEASFYDGDLQKALDDGVRFDELRFLATHNSYQTHSVSSFVRISDAVSEIVPSLVKRGYGTLDQETLTEQLNVGIRSLELDVVTSKESGKTNFLCMHSPVLDMTTNCYDFSLALREVALWSEHNPNHLPITIILEPKTLFVPMPGLRFFSFNDTLLLDDMLREVLGDKLFTPADMLRTYENFTEMRKADDWCKVKDMLGKVLILFHYDYIEQGGILNAYMDRDATFRTQAMFPLHVDSSLTNACFLAFNDPSSALAARDQLTENHFIVRTRTDEHPVYSEQRLSQAMNGPAQILTTDFPPRMREEAYTVSFADGKTVRAVQR